MKKLPLYTMALAGMLSLAVFSCKEPDEPSITDKPADKDTTVTPPPVPPVDTIVYNAPEYVDYYLPLTEWSQRKKWNLSNVHDPSVVLADDGYYYMYQTDASYGNVHFGHGHFLCRRSKDLVNWEFLGSTMPSVPKWVEPKLNEIRKEMGLQPSTVDFNDDTRFGFWAPCVRRVSSNLYRMYYAIVLEGNTIDGADTWSERSFIGMMETSNPANPNSWVDKGYVITNYSDKMLNFRVKPNDWNNCYFKYNAIDPTVVLTPEGEHWMIYGSWHSGFAAVQLDPETGLALSQPAQPWGAENAAAFGKMVYNRSYRQTGQRWQGSEAPEVVYRNGYYYMFIAYDELSIAYNTRVVRSQNIDGPYLDITGRNVTANGGEAYPILTHPYKFGTDHGWVGISHCAVFDDGKDNWYYSSQQRFPKDFNGNPYSNAIMLGAVRSIVWTEEGWPLVLPERYGAVPQTPITDADIVGEWEHINLVYSYQKQASSTSFKLGANHLVESGRQKGAAWAYDASSQTLVVGAEKYYLKRELDWESTPRKATIVYAGLSADGKTTYWGKKAN